MKNSVSISVGSFFVVIGGIILIISIIGAQGAKTIVDLAGIIALVGCGLAAFLTAIWIALISKD